ncbi:MAG: biotin transporter BioY [candidate division Zixibacteria bacterium]|nr:biotin transporter BioY [candidate division Zixibacteria bacterium]
MEPILNNRSTTVYNLIRPSTLWAEIPLLLGFNLLLVAAAYISIPLVFSPVPITGQTFGVMLIAMALGRIRGTAVVTAYLLEGIAGAPVFAGGGAGIHHLFGPTGGYLLGFVPAAFLTGYLADQGWYKGYILSAIAMFIGHAVVFLFGLTQLFFFVPVSGLFAAGLIPFLPGTAIKIGLASFILPSVWKFLGRRD